MPLKNKDFMEERLTEIGLYGTVKPTTPESKQSVIRTHDPIYRGELRHGCTPFYWQSFL